MPTEQAFVQDIREHPDDDAVRLIYADWLDDHGQPDRAEFIRTQIRRRSLPTGHPDAELLQVRADTLLRAHWEEWVRPIWRLVDDGTKRLSAENWLRGAFAPAAVARFPRGFVERLTFLTTRFLAVGGELVCRVPLRELVLLEPDSHGTALAECRALHGMQYLHFADPYRDPVGPRFVRELARSPWLGLLRVLDLYANNLSDDGCAELAEACWLPGLRVLVLADNGMSAEGVCHLGQTRCEFRPRILILNGNPIGDEGVAALAASPILSQVETLGLRHCGIGPEGAAALAHSPYAGSLRELTLSQNRLGQVGWETLARASWWPRLHNVQASD